MAGRAARGAIGGIAVVIGVLAGGAPTAAAPVAAAGACAPAVVPAQSDGEAVIELAGDPQGAVGSAALSVEWSGPPNSDVVAALAGPGDRFVALLAGGAGEGLQLDFSDTAAAPAATLPTTEGSLVGQARPLEPLAGLTGVEAGGPWSLIVLNTSDEDLRITGCQLRLTLVESASATSPATHAPGGALPRTGWDPAVPTTVGLLLVAVGVALTTRRRTALLIVAGLASAGLASVPMAPSGAATSPTVTVLPGFVPVAGPSEWPYETMQTVTVTGLASGQSFLLEQCESNPPPELDPYHVPDVEVDAPVRCALVGPRTYELTNAGIVTHIAPTTFTADAGGSFEQVIELLPSWDRDGEDPYDLGGSCERFTLVIGCILRVLSPGGEVLASTIIGSRCSSSPPVVGLTITPQAGDVPLPVLADGSGSTSGDGSCPSPIESYTFDFGDGTVVGPQATPTALHTYTAPGTYDLRLTVTDENGETSSITKQVLVEVPRPDEDGDGVWDDLDNCKSVPNPTQSDVDADKIGDACDPVDDRPEPPDGEDPEDPEQGACKAFQVDVSGDILGLEWFRFNTSGSACGGTETSGPSLGQLARSGSVELPPLVLAVLSTMFTLQYDPNSNAGGIDKLDATTAEITGSFDLCALPLPPGIGKLVGAKLGKLLDIVSRWGGDRLIAKAARMWLGAFDKLVDITASTLGGSYNTAMKQAWGTVSDSLAAAFESALGAGLNLAVGICVPMWEPTVTVVAKGDGSGVFYDIADQGLPSPRVAIATNAEPL